MLKNCQDLQKNVQSLAEKRKPDPVVKLVDNFNNTNDSLKYIIKNQSNSNAYDYNSLQKPIDSDNWLHTQKHSSVIPPINEVKYQNNKDLDLVPNINNQQVYDFSMLKNSIEPNVITFVKPSSSFKKQNNFEVNNENATSQRSNVKLLDMNVPVQGNLNQQMKSLNDSILNYQNPQTNYSHFNQFTNYPNYSQNTPNINPLNAYTPR